MNFLGGYSIPQREEFQPDGCWIPANPEKTTVPARFNAMLENPVEMNHPSLENWSQMVPNYDSLAQIFDTAPPMGQIPGQFGNMTEATNNVQQRDWNNVPLMELLLGGDSSGYAPSRDSRMASGMPLIPNQERCGSLNFGSGFGYRTEFAEDLHTRNERDWIGSNSGIQSHHNQMEALHNRNVNGLTQEHQYDSPMPSKPVYDLNLSPTINAAHLANNTNSLHFTPFNSSEQRQSDPRSILYEGISRGKEMSGDSVQCAHEAIRQNRDQPLQNIVDSSSTVVSTPAAKETAIYEKNGDLGIDLNETPQQKPPKRRKHRPKVIREKKPKKTPKPAVQKTPESNENRPGKRKYVRKKLPPNSGVEVIDLTGDTAESITPSVSKACKRVLSFDPEEINKNNLDTAAPPQETNNGTTTVSAVQSEVPTGSESQTTNGRRENDQTANLENLVRADPPDLQRVKDLMRNAFLPVPETPYKSSERRGSKRDHSQTVKERTALLSNGHTLHIGQGFDKKSKSGDKIQKHNLNLMSQNIEQSYSALLNSQYNTNMLSERSVGEKYVQSVISGQKSHTGTMGSTLVHNPLIASVQVNSSAQGHFQIFQTSRISTPEKNHMMCTTTQEKPTKRRGPKGKLNDISTPEKNHMISEKPTKRKGAKEKIPQTTPIDYITYRLQILDLNASSGGLQSSKNQNALVPYQGGGILVPYQGDMIKKRKPRPKVDLDSETNRVWNLLMGKEGSENEETADEKKEKWWEEERKVFNGRVDSFIARMHLVQGDRRFSRWKGSVVDSVIGVFLTQNVSDHLSSSAFMSMAARFPLTPRTQVEVTPTVINIDVPIAMMNPDEAIKWHENRIPRELVHHQYGNDTTGTSKEAPIQNSEEEFMLSQESFNSSVTEVVGGIRSSSGSNSETEYPSIGCKLGNGQVSASTDFLPWEVCSQVNLSQTSTETLTHLGSSSSTIPDNPDHLHRNDRLINHGISELWLREPFSEESTSSWQSPPSTSTKGPENVSKSSRTGKSAMSFDNSSREQRGPWWFQETPTTSPDAFFSLDFTNQPSSSDRLKGNETLPVKSNISIEPGKYTEALNKLQNASKLAEMIVGGGDCSSAANSHVHTKSVLVEVNTNENISSSSQPSTVAKTKNPKARKAKDENKNKIVVDWDELRRDVKNNGTETERTKDSMDSLDYEAVRTAKVKDISDTIKERGMNNMLAERMKEFLNRVVKDHGSIDLEWLRDVPPDKAKDYLLSIRGLGLKSVECVRLLTLHHLAFPVDTNVGRIAVRLGWVPLQPLPESLQLHLLELYPILESIQKYLWPRLCKLDQRTLYELHYQMITFGKVFCTKSKPNCNACPMRGECRHFASAFASARLALPGTEDKSIVSSTVPQTEDNNPSPGVVIHPMALPAPDHSCIAEVGSSSRKSCVPIIEEPASPEQECIQEVELSDIEDFEDPNEIPIIEVDMNEFAENLHNYMQNNMELQEADMSKALVALNPNMTHIPIPKLKNISRLRTEHQVYELPDEHPLLEGFDTREPDDPSPYLLAIWTPGETANSIQPPEKCCASESDDLCSDPTCFSCSSMKESFSQTVRGTILVPCRTAMRGSFPLNGTYFQVNEMFADHRSSHNPIDVPRKWIWCLPRRTVYFGTSVSSIFKGLTTPGIQYCFWKGFVCVRGFEKETRAPRPLSSRLHFVASKLAKTKKDEKDRS